MEHLFLNKELSLLAKSKGFDEPCLAYFGIGELEFDFANKNSSPNFKRRDFTTAPLFQQIVDWFRLLHNIEVHSPVKQIEENEYGVALGWCGVEEWHSQHYDQDYYKAWAKAITEAFNII
jgi:hypothetical protein